MAKMNHCSIWGMSNALHSRADERDSDFKIKANVLHHNVGRRPPTPRTTHVRYRSASATFLRNQEFIFHLIFSSMEYYYQHLTCVFTLGGVTILPYCAIFR